jgi:hypothetical protein
VVDNPFVVPQAVIEHAVSIMAEHADNWPDDDWYSIGADWDLNLFRSDSDGTDSNPQATLYAVVNGNTKTAQGHPLAPAKVLSDRGLAIPH